MTPFADSFAPVPPSATQPVAQDLLDDRGIALALSELEASPRVRLETIARSHEGRPVVLIIVGMPEALANLERHRRVTEGHGPLASGGLLPVLFAGASWGHEASQVEGLLKAARILAFEETEDVKHALSGTIALIIPLMNPDGRAAALRAHRPGKTAWNKRRPTVLATLSEVSARPERYRDAVYDRQLADETEAAGRFVVIPDADQPADGLEALLDLLKLYRVIAPYPAFVVPLEQPESRIARHLLLGEWSKLNEAPPALGVRVLSSESLTEDERRPFREARFEPGVLSLPAPPEDEAVYAARPTVRSTALVNRLLASGAARVYPLQGRFHIAGGGATIRWEAARLGVPLVAAPATPGPEILALRLPRVAIYAGQGIPHSESGEIAWSLERGGFPWRRLDAVDFSRDGCLTEVDVLVVPNGSAGEIVSGWNADAPNRKAPWQTHEPAKGIGEHGLNAVRAFVEAGGTYVGLGGGGGLLACADYLRIADAGIVPAAVGLGQVSLKIVRPDSALLFGYPTDQPVPAFFYAPPGSLEGGHAFQGGAGAVALYDGVQELREELSFVTTEPLSSIAGNAAIVHQRFGRGHVVLLGIAPAFRAQWQSTFRLLYNALHLLS